MISTMRTKTCWFVFVFLLVVGCESTAHFKLYGRDLVEVFTMGDVPDSWASLYVDNKWVQDTRKIDNSYNPDWGTTLRIHAGKTARIEVWDDDPAGNPSDKVGQATFEVAELHYMKHGDRIRYDLCCGDKGYGGYIILERLCW